ncbi:hypothetical protein Agub_g10109 [Astrephomene gubernaculifera]|uniref:Cilium assembly protein DZIP1 N-terminal domain-containing protein n=1 Tax=Astrephomene gubernaculifera TaxID=47775 RepID=A0AAD3HPJ8_9CHLO|nr:hypothetical protein Agub_g10109 [Astrephomene gubernaculifera]
MTTTFPRTMGYGLGSSLRGGSTWGHDPYDHQMRDQTMTAAPTFPPFKFEARRARIDWRLLHGIDISAMMRDVDLDTLEKIVNIVAFGDIEAEDTRHLTELNFIKIFRLSQMMIEYLLYVQDCLQSSNSWLQQDRNNMDKYIQAARLRLRELEANLKMNKRELRRARKTIKTYELLAVINDGKAAKTTTAAPPAAPVAPPSPPPPPPPPPQAPAKPEINPVNVAMEALLRKELVVLAERLSKATMECQALRGERDDLYQAVKDLEASVKARAHLSGGSSPQGYIRQNQEALQTIQGLQDQLNRATAEITKLRNEKDELTVDLERATTDNRQLVDEKGRLLAEIASRPAETGPASDNRPVSDNLGSLLLDAERQKAEIKDELEEARAEIAALQKQLMKAMKATAFAPMGMLPPSQGPDERVVRELELAKAQLEKELADVKRTYDEDVRQLHEELEMTQAKAVEADRRLAELRATAAAAPGERTSVQPAGGFVKVVEERRGDRSDDEQDASVRNLKKLLAEYEAMNERLNQQLSQLKDERNTLAEEVEQLRSQLQSRPSPARLSPAAGDQSIGRDWRTEEIERLKGECDASQRRVQSLEEALRDRDALVERLRATIRDLQAQLEERTRQQQETEASMGRVKQQIQQFERLAGPSHVKTSSFSFIPEDAQQPGSAPLETPSSVRKPSQPEVPSRTPSPVASSPPSATAGDSAPPAFTAPSPQRSEQQLDPSASSKWLRRIPRPAPAEAYNIQQTVLKRVAGLKPEALDMMLAEEIRVITENPYEYGDDDEAVFRAMLPYELAERPGVLSVERHELKDLETARGLLTDQLLAVLDDEMAQYGLDPSAEAISDKAYAASMQELAAKRSQLLERQPRETQERAERLREALLTHLELMKRLTSEQQVREQQQRLQEEQRQAGALAGAAMSEIQPEGAVEGGRQATAGSGAAAGTGAVAVAVAAGAVATAAAVTAGVVAASRAQSSSGASSHDEPPAAASAAAAAPPQSQLPAFPPRQPSLPRSIRTSSGGDMDELRGMLPAPGMPPAGAAQRPNPETVQAERSRTSVPGQGPAGSTRTSPATSPLQRSLQPGAALPDRPTADSHPDASVPPSHNSSRRSAPNQQSLPRSTTSLAPASQQPSREASQGAPVVLGHAPPAPAARTVTPAAAAAASSPGGNMNMSIRSVKYQDSDFDDEDDVVPLPQPKAVARVVEDEYTLTEDEEAQHDMGIQDSDDDFAPVSAQPKILMRGGASSPPAPSRFAPTPAPAATSAVTQSRGWANDEPLQRAPAPSATNQRSSETAEIEELESIQSFNNTLSQSLPRRPGAWGSPNSTMRKPAMVRDVREPSNQMSGTTIKSFGATSVSRDEVQGMQDLTGVDSFTDNVRPAGRFMAPRSAFQAAGAAPSRQVARRQSTSSEVSDIEYI